MDRKNITKIFVDFKADNYIGKTKQLRYRNSISKKIYYAYLDGYIDMEEMFDIVVVQRLIFFDNFVLTKNWTTDVPVDEMWYEPFIVGCLDGHGDAWE